MLNPLDEPSSSRDVSQSTISNYKSAVSAQPSRSSSASSSLSEATLNDDTTLLSEAIIPSKNSKSGQQEQSSQQLLYSSNETQPKFLTNPHHGVSLIDTDDYGLSPPDDSLDSSFMASTKYENGEWALLSYSRTNKIEKLKALLDCKFRKEISLNLNYKGQQKKNFSWTALHLACYFGHIEVVQLLLSKPEFREELNINIQNNSGDTPLHKAALTNRVQIVQLLLSNGANVFIENCDALLARQLTDNREILDMLEAVEQVDRNQIKLDLFKAVDNGNLKTLEDYIRTYSFYQEISCNNSTKQELHPTELATHCLDDDHRTDNMNDSQCDPNTNRETTNLNEEKNDIEHDHENNKDYLRRTDEPLMEMVDERGNTLLHLASMRGFKAICVYLLEQGLDPYRRNNLGQTCFDLSSNKLQQLFSQVKPSNDRLKRISKHRVGRFEGPLLKKLRILGWKQIYVVLENGVILLFNNKRDSMNKSRRGYKYLESATCEMDKNEIAIFTINFSDRSKATFAVSPDHLKFYNAFNRIQQQQQSSSLSPSNNNNERFNSSRLHHQQGCMSPKNQIELVRQKWLDSLADHIQYSTDFIRRGLNFNEQDDDYFYGDNGNFNSDGTPTRTGIANLNHLLPVDTMKSFVQEARAHYNILQRHAELLWNLVQQINTTFDRSNQSVDVINDEEIDRFTNNNDNEQNKSLNATPIAATTSPKTLEETQAKSLSFSHNSNDLSRQSQTKQQQQQKQQEQLFNQSTSTITTSRLFGLIKTTTTTTSSPAVGVPVAVKRTSPSSPARANSFSQNIIKTSSSSASTSLPGSGRSQNRSFSNANNNIDYHYLTNKFLNEDWHCILFHLRLLLESSQNTNESMGQAISLIEHQEHIRQARLQDLERRCKILENSLHTLARDHHELEKSVSGSQLGFARTYSMSTDINEYHDAFEDFDEEQKTMTPSSMPSDEDLNRRIQEVMDEDNDDDNQVSSSHNKQQGYNFQAGPSTDRNKSSRFSSYRIINFAGRLVGVKKRALGSNENRASQDDELDDEEDLESNCSALTVETLSETMVNNVTSDGCQEIESMEPNYR